MYGCFIKGKGWIQYVIRRRATPLRCCRNASDIDTEFIFNTPDEFKNVNKKYNYYLRDHDIQVIEIPRADLIKKRAVAGKKVAICNKMLQKVTNVKFPRNPYCNRCGIEVVDCECGMGDIREYKPLICIHCIMEIYDTICEVYDDIDDDIKTEWAVARTMDTI